MLLTLLTPLLALTGITLAAPAPAPAAEVTTTNFNTPAPYDFISLAAAGKMDANLVSRGVSGPAVITKRNVGGVRMSDGVNFTGHVWVSC